MSHDSHPSAGPGSSGSGILQTLSDWVRPESAEASLTVVGMIDDVTKNTVMTLRRMFALPIAAGFSAIGGVMALSNKLLLGLPYSVIDRISGISNDTGSKIYQCVGGAVS